MHDTYDLSPSLHKMIASLQIHEGPGGHTSAYNEAHGVPRFWHGFSFHHTNFLTCEMRVDILCIALNLGSVVLVNFFMHECIPPVPRVY